MKITQDVTLWMTNELHKSLTNVIMAKEKYSVPYYIMVIFGEGYHGPPAACVNPVRVVDLEGKIVVHNTIVLMNNPPPTPMLNTSLWRIDNKIGEARCCYILPPDKPIIFGSQMGEGSKFIWKSSQNAPLVYASN